MSLSHTPLHQRQPIRLVAALLLLGLGLLVSHAAWSPGHDALECGDCLLLEHGADYLDEAAVVTLSPGSFAPVRRIRAAASNSFLTLRTRAPPVVLTIQ